MHKILSPITIIDIYVVIGFIKKKSNIWNETFKNKAEN